MAIDSLIPFNSLWWKYYYYKVEKWRIEKLSNLFKVDQLVGGEAGIWTSSLQFSAYMFHILMTNSTIHPGSQRKKLGCHPWHLLQWPPYWSTSCADTVPWIQKGPQLKTEWMECHPSVSASSLVPPNSFSAFQKEYLTQLLFRFTSFFAQCCFLNPIPSCWIKFSPFLFIFIIF